MSNRDVAISNAPEWQEDGPGLLILELGELAERALHWMHMDSCGEAAARHAVVELKDCDRCRRDYATVRRYREYTHLAPEADGHRGSVEPDGTWQDECSTCGKCGQHCGSSTSTAMRHYDRCDAPVPDDDSVLPESLRAKGWTLAR